MAEAEEPKQAKKSGKSMMVVLLALGVLVFVALAVVVYLLLQSPSGALETGGGAAPVETAFQYPGSDDSAIEFQTNLSGQRSFINASMWLHMDVAADPSGDDKARKGRLEDELMSKRPLVEEAVIEVFNTTPPEDFGSLSAREAVKEKIKERINRFLVNGKVVKVIMTQVIQPLE